MTHMLSCLLVIFLVTGTAARQNGTLSQALQEFCTGAGYQPGQPSQPLVLGKFLDVLAPFIEKVQAPLTMTTPPEIEVNCANPQYSSVLTGQRRSTPAKIIDLISFFAELDLLEMRLYELDGIVDHVVLLESLNTQQFYPSPMMFTRNRFRFERFLPKILHVVADGVAIPLEVSTLSNHGTFRADGTRRKMLWEKYVAKYGPPGENDLFIHGDLDEIPSATAIKHLKYCEMSHPSVGLSVIFNIFNTNYVFAMDVRERLSSHAYSYRYPTVTRGRTAAEFLGNWRSARLRVLHHTGGLHMNNYGFLPYMLAKEASAADNIALKHICRGAGTRSTLRDLQNQLTSGQFSWRGRVFSTSVVRSEPLPWVPWIAKANEQRYPFFFGKWSHSTDFLPADNS